MKPPPKVVYVVVMPDGTPIDVYRRAVHAKHSAAESETFRVVPYVPFSPRRKPPCR